MRNSLALVLVLVLGLAAHASAQQVDELALIRDATAREQAGDFAGSRQILERILRSNPQSLTALLSLERVLRMEGSLQDLIPYAEAHLKEEQTSPIGHQMLIRAFSSLDKVSDLDRAGEAWVRATPKVETPYREIARVWQQRGDFSKALHFLELGRSRIGRADALALELGDAYAGLDEHSRAVREWHRAIGPQARGLLLVQRRLAALRDGGAHILPGLIDNLTRNGGTARKRAAAILAIDAGLSQRAEQVVRETAVTLKGQERQLFLVEMARRADAAQLPRVAFWAYSEMGPTDMTAEQQLATRARIAELALAVGDTATAARSYKELEQSLALGSPERRQAVALRIQLMVKEGRLADAERELANFRVEFTNAPESDAVAAAIASAYIEKADLDEAEKSLVGVIGPRSAIARGRLALRRGDVSGAKQALLSAAPSLQGAEATETIRLVTLLGKVSKTGGELLAKAIARSNAGAYKEAFMLLEKGAATLPEVERASILDFAAGIADRADLPLDAERARRKIILDFPRSIEAPAALLALARSLTDRGEAVEEARTYLEKLIVEYPRSALVPQARQELDRLRQQVRT